jgi:hypothetical protein
LTGVAALCSSISRAQHSMKELLDTHWKDKTVRAYDATRAAGGAWRTRQC